VGILKNGIQRRNKESERGIVKAQDRSAGGKSTCVTMGKKKNVKKKKRKLSRGKGTRSIEGAKKVAKHMKNKGGDPSTEQEIHPWAYKKNKNGRNARAFNSGGGRLKIDLVSGGTWGKNA